MILSISLGAAFLLAAASLAPHPVPLDQPDAVRESSIAATNVRFDADLVDGSVETSRSRLNPEDPVPEFVPTVVLGPEDPVPTANPSQAAGSEAVTAPPRAAAMQTGPGDQVLGEDRFVFLRSRTTARPSLDFLPEIARGAVAPSEYLVVIYVPGARVVEETSCQRGQQLFRHFSRCKPASKRLIFITWNWPSVRTKRAVQDFRASGPLGEVDSVHLAHFMAAIDPQVSVSVLGYSLGSRLVTGAMHTLGGGRLRCAPAGPSAGDVVAPRVVLWAAGVETNWILPGRYHHRAVPTISRMIVMYNSKDPVLKRFRIVSRLRRSTALGFTGINTCQLGYLGYRVQSIDFSWAMKRTHEFEKYIGTPCIFGRTLSFLVGR